MTAELRGEIARVESVRGWIDRAVYAVAAGALVFTMLNVSLFAADHGTPWWMAWLLDPLASVALLAVLVGDGVLSRHGVASTGWAVALKWFAALATWSMNIWTSFAAGDVAGVLLHSVAPGLVVLLAQAAPGYRLAFGKVLARLRHEVTDLEHTGTVDAARAHTVGAGREIPAPEVCEQTVEIPVVTAPELPPATPPPAPKTAPAKRHQVTASGRAKTRPIEQLRAELREAIDMGAIGAPPSAEQIRKHLGVGPVKARTLRDEYQQDRLHVA
jgi:hypothetical protein